VSGVHAGVEQEEDDHAFEETGHEGLEACLE
jgi:hypothetical protein